MSNMPMHGDAAPKKPPPSVVRWIDPLLIAALIVGTYTLFRTSVLSSLQLGLLIIGVIIAVMVPIEFFSAPWRGKVRPIVPFNLTAKRAAIKTLGIMLGIGLVLAAWLLFQEYQKEYYWPLFKIIPYGLIVAPFIVAPTVFYTEWRLGPSNDHSWQFGLLALGRWKEVDWNIARNGLFGWIVKGFFLPINFVSAIEKLDFLRGREAEVIHLFTIRWPHAVALINAAIFTALLFAIIPGYLFSSRLLGTENRRIDQTGFGWFVTLLCYSPLNEGTGPAWFLFHGNYPEGHEPWTIIFGVNGILAYCVGGLLLFFEFIHYWGEATCHIHSAHLSNRGIITNGPYRYSKHPVYASRGLAWGLMWLPFLAGENLLDDLRLSLAFFAFCGIFVLRGWVEERLLSHDQTYIDYALWMDRHSLFRIVGRAIPFFSYRWRLEWWRKNGQIEVSEAD